MPEERIRERIVEETSDVPVPHAVEEILEAVKFIPEDEVQNYTVEQLVDVTVPQIREETGQVTQLFPVRFFFLANRPFAADHQSESARCVQHTERNRRSRRLSTARVRHGRNGAHEALVPVGPEVARVAEQLRLHLAHLLDHVHLRLQLPQVVVGGLLGQSLAESAKLARAPGCTQHCRTAPQTWLHAEQLLDESTDSEAVS